MEPPPFGGGNLSSLQRPIPISLRFNGATPFRRWKFADALMEFVHLIEASMEPPPFGGGNMCQSRCGCLCRACFNGATPFRRWKCGKHDGVAF